MARVRKNARRRGGKVAAPGSTAARPTGSSADRRPHIGLLTAVWRRPALTEIVFAHYAQMTHDVKDEVRMSLVAVGSEGFASKRRADRYGWGYVEYPNYPLGAKWNAGLPALRDLGVDAVLIVGSDDLLNAAAVLRYGRALRDGVRYVGLQDLYFYDQPTDRTIHWPGYDDERAGESAGLGRCIHRSYIEAVAWKLWDDEKEHGLDGSMREILSPILDDPARAAERVAWRCGEHGIMAVDVKTRTNMWQFNLFAEQKKLPPADTASILDAHFPAEIVGGIRKLTPDGASFVDAKPPEAELTGSTPAEEAAEAIVLGEKEFAKGGLSTATNFFRHALLFEPDNPRALNDLGVALAQQGDRENAEWAFMRAMLMGDPTQAALNLVEIAMDAAQLKTAARILDAASRLGAGGPEFTNALQYVAAALEASQRES